MRRVLALADAVAIVAVGGALLAIEGLTQYGTAPDKPALLLVPALALWFLLAVLAGAYHLDEKRLDCSVADEIGSIIQVGAMWTWGLFLLDALAAHGSPPITPALASWVLVVCLVLIARTVGRSVARRSRWYREMAFVVGRPDDVERVARVFDRHPECGVTVSRKLTLDPGFGPGRVEELIDLAEASEIDRVILASSYEGLDERTGAMRFLAEQGIKVDLVPGDSEVFCSDAELHFVEGLPLLTLPSTNSPRSAAMVKRALDLLVAAAGLLALSPLLAYVAIRIKLDSPGPVFFRQPRAGRDGETFHVLKFRTMFCDAEERRDELLHLNIHGDGKFKAVEDPRVTRFGARLRRWSLDELPQLLNVLRGEMSLVGPRPLPVPESELIKERYQARFNVRPGITGPWQVLGRSDIPFHEMLKLDYAYVTNWSLPDDLKLMLRTAGAIAGRRGAY